MSDLSYSIYEISTNEQMGSPKDGKFSVGNAVFLKPCVKNSSQAMKFPMTPLLFDKMSERELWRRRVDVKCLFLPQKRWDEWIEKMAGKYASVWFETGICDAILSSRYEIRGNKDLVLGLVEFWCPESNTFVFPWGEATVTLEDVMVLGGFSPIGESVANSLNGEMVKVEEALMRKRSMMSSGRSRKASHGYWIKHFMEGNLDCYEHEAFLSLWLSRYALTSLPEDVINKHVFSPAIRLSSGTRLALGPAVLASLYRNLTWLKEQAISSSLEAIVASGPMQLLHLWAFERFPSLGPSMPNTLIPGEPRAARFHKLNARINLPLVRSVLRLADNFVWRPYGVDLKNWNRPSFYKEKTAVALSSDSIEVEAFARCLLASKLVGTDCEEMYLPQRVAMQFGYDQDLPGDPFDHDISCKDVKFVLRSCSVEARATARYINWWKKGNVARKEAMQANIKMILKRRSESVQAKGISKKYPTVADALKLKSRAKVQECYSREPDSMKTQMNECRSKLTGSNEDSSDTDHIPLSQRLIQIAAVEKRRIKSRKLVPPRSFDGSHSKKKFKPFHGRSRKAAVHKTGDFAKGHMMAEEGKTSVPKSTVTRSEQSPGFESKSEKAMAGRGFENVASSIQNFGFGQELEDRLMKLETIMGIRQNQDTFQAKPEV